MKCTAYDVFVKYNGMSLCLWCLLALQCCLSDACCTTISFLLNTLLTTTVAYFFSAGNYISCNYIYNSRWCYYLDAASSGVTIEGGVCNGSYATVKVNGGKLYVSSPCCTVCMCCTGISTS